MLIARTPQFIIYKGSTPCLECAMSEALLDTDTIYATFWQLDHRVIEYNKNGTTDPTLPEVSGRLEIDEENPALLQILMTQSDTLQLQTGEVELQIRVKRSDGGEVLADTMVPVFGRIGPAYKEGAI